MRRQSFIWLAGILLAFTAIGLTSMDAPRASAVLLAPESSCGQSMGGGSVPNAYCSVVANGDAVIGEHSCNVIDACTNLGDGARINPYGLPFGEGSCNGPLACTSGGMDGKFEVGMSSCNGDHACHFGGVGGAFKVGSYSCNDGGYACASAGEDFGDFIAGSWSCNGVTACQSSAINGVARIGKGTCNGNSACYRTGLSFIAGHDSCNGYNACYVGGSGLSFQVAHGSCNGEEACEFAGVDGFGPLSVGSFSCNQSGTFDDECTNATAAPAPAVGDCMYNDPSPLQVIILRQVGCALSPAFGAFEAVWQEILGIFTFD